MQSPSSKVPVLIVGAGPTGLTLACDLARRAVNFRIVDKAPAYFAGSRGKGLQPRSLEVFDDLGVVERILQHGRFHVPFRSYDGVAVTGDWDMHAGRNPTPDVPYASPLLIPQWRVEETLRQRLAGYGQRVDLATELISLEQNERGVTAVLETEGERQTLPCEYLVGADGGRSFVRKFMNFGFEGETWKDERMFVGDVRVDGLDRDHWHAWPKHPDGWLALCPLPSTEAFQLQAAIPPGADDEEPSLAVFQRIVAERTGRTDLKLHDPTWLSLYRVNIRMVDRYRMGRVFLAGDAAHVHTPVGGQGMNTGIQDSYNLGWKLGLVLEGASTSLLETYEEERLPVAASMLGLTTRLARGFRANQNQIPRDAETLQLGIHYRDSPLSRRDGSSSFPLEAGDRAPDAPLLDTHNRRRVRLFDLFRGPHFTLLSLEAHGARQALDHLAQPKLNKLRVCFICRAQGDADDFADTFLDDGGHVAHAYGEGALVVVRPDGYIGWLGAAGDGDALARAGAYLSGVTG